MTRKKTIITICAVAFLALMGAGSAIALIWYQDNRKANFNHSQILYVYPETTLDDIMTQVSDSATVKNAKSLARSFAKENVAQRLQPGKYEIKPSASSIYVARMLANGWQTPCKLTLSGSLRQKGQIARKIANQMMVDSAAVMHALSDDALLSAYGFDSASAFAMIIPDTYEMWWTASVEDILARFKKEYDSFWTEERKAKASAQSLTPLQVSVVASIVKGESNYVPEYPKIAGVYLNRYHIGMKLQADPTVAFCYDYTLNRILRKHLEIDSPYNTYKYAGLPPAPICSPTKECLDAVLNPDVSDGYLYFCADASFNGQHRFARSYLVHLQNARAFQKALNNRNNAL